MNWTDIQKNWPALKDRITTDHTDIDTDALERTEEGRRQLLQLIEAKYGVARPKAEDDLDRIVKGEENGRESSD